MLTCRHACAFADAVCGHVQDFEEIRALMKGEGLSDSAIGAFQQAYEQLVRGDDGMISEASISPASDVPVMSDLKNAEMSDEKAKEVTFEEFKEWSIIPNNLHQC